MPDFETEKSFQSAVMKLAKQAGWLRFHPRPSQAPSGRYVTNFDGDKGWPDLALARNGVVVLAELKTESGKLTDGQKEWIEASGGLIRVWRPSDWNEITETLTGQATLS